MSKGLKIYACSGVGGSSLSDQVTRNLENAGWQQNEELRKYLGGASDGGCAAYFLYTFIPDSDLSKYNAVIYKKRKGQIKTYQYVRELFTSRNFGSEAELLQIIRSGIERDFGVPVEQVLYDIRSGKREGISGEPISMAVATIISAVISLVIAVISGVISYAQNVKVAKYTAPTFTELEDSAPSPTDFTSNAKNKGVLLAALTGLGLLVFGSLKNN